MKNPVQEAIITALAEKTGLLPGCKRLGMDAKVDELIDLIHLCALLVSVGDGLGISRDIIDTSDIAEINTIGDVVRLMTVCFIRHKICDGYRIKPRDLYATANLQLENEVEELTCVEFVIEMEGIFDLPAANLYDRSVWVIFQTPAGIIEYFLKQLGIDEVGERDLTSAMAVG